MEVFNLENFCQRLEGMDRETISTMIGREIEQLNRENDLSSNEDFLTQTTHENNIESLHKLLSLVENKETNAPTLDEAIIFNRVMKSRVEDETSDF